mmetsp:Transcript_71555/g.190314  ORF Transcript_71555/g.190314 Transcript_71555/m.190314 type:complete len:337 (+) Transcript_71555:907-1917(+)
MLEALLVEVRDLQQLVALHVERLHQAPPELDHCLCREEPLAHACDLDHGLGDLHGVLEQLVGVLTQLVRHEVVQALHVRPDEELVLHDDRQLELALLVLRYVLREGLHLRVVRGPGGHAPALGRRRQQLWAVLESGGLVDVVPEKLQGLDHHAVGSVVLRALVVADEGHGHHKEQHEEEEAEDHEVVLLLQQEGWQTNANLRGLWAVGVAVLLVVLLRDLVGQRVVGLRDLDEARGRQGVVGILVGVVDEGELAVGLLDLRGGRRMSHLQDVEGVEPPDLGLRAHGGEDHDEAGPDQRQHRDLDHPAASGPSAAHPRFAAGLVNLLLHVRSVALSE